MTSVNMLRFLALSTLLCYAVTSVEAGCQASMQRQNFVFAEHGQENSLVAGECHLEMDYHPFPTEPYQIRSGWLRELSGIARSGLQEDVFWGHNDGKVNSIFAIRLGDKELSNYKYRHDHGEVIARAHLPTTIERQTDWEDIDTALCPDGSGRSCIWIADTGDNSKRRNRPRIHVVVEPELQLNHHTAGKGEFYDVHLCDQDTWTFQFEFEYEDNDQWVKGGSFDIEAMVVSPAGDKFWLFEKKQHWEDNVWGWPRVFESPNVAQALRYKRGDHFIQTKAREITKFPRACEKAPEAWRWLARPSNSFWAERIIEDEKIATSVYKYKKMHEYGHREGLKEMFMNGTDCTAFPPIFWMITGANLHPKGTRLAIQTYSGAFEYTFSSPMNFSELAFLKPRQLGLPRFDQMESIVYSHDGKSLFAIPEALSRKGWQKVQHIRCVKVENAPKLDVIEIDVPKIENATSDDDQEAIAIRSLEEEPLNQPEPNSSTIDSAKQNAFSSFLHGIMGTLKIVQNSVGTTNGTIVTNATITTNTTVTANIDTSHS